MDLIMLSTTNMCDTLAESTRGHSPRTGAQEGAASPTEALLVVCSSMSGATPHISPLLITHGWSEKLTRGTS